LNKFERPPLPAREAVVQFCDADFRIVRPGDFVRCAVTGRVILIEDLRYWSVERQEAYAGVEAVRTSLGARRN
jgi:hypothetical protein